jgi:hypothetical protein
VLARISHNRLQGSTDQLSWNTVNHEIRNVEYTR